MLLVNPQEGAAEIASLELAMILHNLMVAAFDHIIVLVFKVPDAALLKTTPSAAAGTFHSLQ